MGAYAYCTKCNSGFDRPTIYEAALGQLTCSSCNHIHELYEPRVDLAILLTELEERVAALENKSPTSP